MNLFFHNHPSLDEIKLLDSYPPVKTFHALSTNKHIDWLVKMIHFKSLSNKLVTELAPERDAEFQQTDGDI